MLFKNKEIQDIKLEFIGIEEYTIRFSNVLTYIPKFKIKGSYNNINFDHILRIYPQDLRKMFCRYNNTYCYASDENKVLKVFKNIKDNINNYKIKKKIIKHFYERYNKKIKKEKIKAEKEELIKELKLIESK